MVVLSKYRSIDAPFDRDEIVLLNKTGTIQTIEIDGYNQKVLCSLILRHVPQQLQLPFLTCNLIDHQRLQKIIYNFEVLKLELTTRFNQFKKIKLFGEHRNCVVYVPNKYLYVSSKPDNFPAHRHYFTYFLNDHQIEKVSGKTVDQELKVYTRFEIFVKNKKIHNENSWAAKITQIGRREILFWMQDSKLHNMDGPAVIHGDKKHFYTYGKVYSP